MPWRHVFQGAVSLALRKFAQWKLLIDWNPFAGGRTPERLDIWDLTGKASSQLSFGRCCTKAVARISRWEPGLLPIRTPRRNIWKRWPRRAVLLKLLKDVLE